MVCGGFLRDGACAGEFAAFAGGGVAGIAGLTADDSVGDFWALLSWITQAAQMATGRLWRVGVGFLCISLPRYGMAEPAGSIRRKNSRQSAAGGAGDCHARCAAWFADSVHPSCCGASVHWALLQLCEL